MAEYMEEFSTWWPVADYKFELKIWKFTMADPIWQIQNGGPKCKEILHWDEI